MPLPSLIPQKKLDFSDVLILPLKSKINSRNDVNPVRNIDFGSKGTWTGVPLMIANMDTTGTIEMALEAEKYQVITCLHKFYTSEDIELIKTLNPQYFAITTGTGENDIKRLEQIVDNINCRFICIDVANGYSDRFRDACKYLRDKYPQHILIAGNIATPDYLEELAKLNIDIVKIGIGSGSVCTTRIQTGIGFPQFSAVMESSPVAKKLGIKIISDGGIQNAGDIGKALCAGADFVMSGGLFSGHDQCAGDLIVENNIKYKIFYGMSSATAMTKYEGGVRKYRSAEGKSVKIQYKGCVTNTLDHLLGGLRSTLSYINCSTVDEISDNQIKFIIVNNQYNRIFNNN